MKITLAQVRKLSCFKEINQPEFVYHMTNRNNLDSIMSEGKIKNIDSQVVVEKIS